MLTFTANALIVVIAAGVFAQLLAVAWVGGKVLRPRLAARRRACRTVAPKADTALALNVRARRRLRRDYRLALLAARA